MVVSAATQVIKNKIAGKSWYEGVIGAAAGGFVYGAVIAATCNPVAAGFASAAAESITNEVISYTDSAYLSGVEKKTATKDNILGSVANVVTDTATNGTELAITGKLAGKIIPTNKGWFKPVKLVSCFIGKYAIKSTVQTVVQSSVIITTRLVGKVINALTRKGK